MEIRKAARGVYAILTRIGDPRGDSNFGLITGPGGVMLIDADIRRWEETSGLVRSVTDQPVRYLINTHDNFDHTSANTLLAREGAVIIASQACRSILSGAGRREYREKISQDLSLGEKYGSDDLTLPYITTDGCLRIDLGDRIIETIFLGHAHTPGDMAVYLPDEGILFAGDVLFNGCHPVTRNADIASWLKVIDFLEALPVRLTVPGHGEPSSGKINLASLRGYFETLRLRVGELKSRGLTLEQVEKQLELPEFASWGKKNWLPGSIKKIYSDLS